LKVLHYAVIMLHVHDLETKENKLWNSQVKL
jgi:hypothetical protein